MKNKIQFKIIGKHIDIYLEWLDHETLEASNIIKSHEISYQTFYNIMDQWMEEGLVSRIKKEKKEKIREGFYEYHLTEKGFSLLNELSKILSRMKIKGFEEYFRKNLHNLGIEISDEDFTTLVKNILAFFS